MKTFNKIAIPVFFIALATFSLYLNAKAIYNRGHQDGWLVGYTEANDDTKRWKCEIDYSDVSLSEVPGDCLQYFVKGEK